MVRGEINEKTTDIQARSFTARTLDEIGKKCQAEGERQKNGHMKSQNSIMPEKLRGIYFIDPEDKEFKETIKNARKKLETPVAAAMPCKISKNSQNWVTRGKSPMRSNQDCVQKNLYRIIMKTILRERETIHCSITIWYTSLFRKGSSGLGMGKIGKDSGVEPDESQK